MTVNYESISDKAFYEYEKLFFEEICSLDTEGRDSFDTPLPGMEQIHFACVQDTVERLTELTGKLSTFQWRNCLFVPIDRNARPKDIYKEVFEELKHSFPSLFIRSYVYVVFIKVYGAGVLDFGIDADDARVSKDDIQIYKWNTNYDIKWQKKVDLFNLASKGEANARRETKTALASEKVFIVANPAKELQRIQDANSDVIDAVKAFCGELDLVEQTGEYLNQIEDDFSKPDSRILVEGPARSGKTILAMSLLGSVPHSKMLLMNWYFWDALMDAFRVWKNLDDAQLAALFSLSKKTENLMSMREVDMDLLSARAENESLISELADIWAWLGAGKRLTIRYLSKSESFEGKGWLVSNPLGKRPGDFVLVQRKFGNAEAMIVDKPGEGDPDGYVRTRFLTRRTKYSKLFTLFPCDGNDQYANEKSKHLIELEREVQKHSFEKAIAQKLKDIAEAIYCDEARFFHHDARGDYSRGSIYCHYKKSGAIALPPGRFPLIVDEAQRLWQNEKHKEVDWVKEQSPLFLCGDDNQRLNRRGDCGLGWINEVENLKRYDLPGSIGIPAEIGVLVKAMLCKPPIPKVSSSFNIKLIYNDDLALVEEFEKDPSGKKHYAIPVSTGFLLDGDVPAIMKASSATKDCDNQCSEKSGGYCLHRFIRMLKPMADPRWLQGGEKRKDLSEAYKFFCAEAIMPNYALSAYELISREVEGLYLKIPKAFDKKVLDAPIDGDGKESWMKRHLYVLMTRATANLVINVEDKCLYDHFRAACKQAGMNCDID